MTFCLCPKSTDSTLVCVRRMSRAAATLFVAALLGVPGIALANAGPGSESGESSSSYNIDAASGYDNEALEGGNAVKPESSAAAGGLADGAGASSGSVDGGLPAGGSQESAGSKSEDGKSEDEASAPALPGESAEESAGKNAGVSSGTGLLGPLGLLTKGGNLAAAQQAGTSASGQPSGQPTDTSLGQLSGQSSGQPSEQSREQSAGQLSGQPSGQASEQLQGQPSNQPANQITGQSQGAFSGWQGIFGMLFASASALCALAALVVGARLASQSINKLEASPKQSSRAKVESAVMRKKLQGYSGVSDQTMLNQQREKNRYVRRR